VVLYTKNIQLIEITIINVVRFWKSKIKSTGGSKMKYRSVVCAILLALLVSFNVQAIDTLTTPRIPEQESNIQRTMEVPYDKKEFSGLTYVLGDTAYIKIYSSLTQQDELWLWDDLQLLINNYDVVNLKVFLDSFGGGAYAGFAIGDQFTRVKDRFNMSVHASGVVASAAVMVFAAFDERYASENCFFMVHEVASPPTSTSLSASDVKLMDALFDKLTDQYVGVLVKNSNRTISEWEGMLEEETWFSAREAKEWGLVTEVK
jgi:ATP-dependent protease ClpP protease subunit